jgi:hypothetical protein
VGRERASDPAPKGQLMWLGLMMLVALSGLCTIFASVVTAAQARQEHAQARWPEVTARVDRCGLNQTSSGRREKYYIHCRLRYAVGAEQNGRMSIRAMFLRPRFWQFPPHQIGSLEQWVDEHPPGGADRRALRSRRPQESGAGGEPHAARRTANAKQYEATGSLGGKFPGPADDCANHTAAIPSAKRVFFNAAEPIGCPFCIALLVAENKCRMVPQEIRKEPSVPTIR